MDDLICLSHIRTCEVICVKTTLNLNDQVLRRSKDYASRHGMTLTAFVEDALRAKLVAPTGSAKPFKLVLKTVRGSSPPNVDVSDRDALYDVLDRE